MTAEQAVAFLQALGAKQIRDKENGWVEAACPLARWTHKNRVDHSPSFGLRVAPGERSNYLCFACRQGSAEELLQTIELYAQGSEAQNYDFARCHQILADEEYVVPLPEYGEFAQKVQPFMEWPQYWLDSFVPAEMVQASASYLTHRGVTLETVMQYRLHYDKKRQMIVAPYWDVFSRFAGARGRSIVKGAAYAHHDYTFQGVNNARLCWYHEAVLNLPGPVVVVEGQFDVMRVAQVFPKVVGNLTAKPTAEKMKKLGDCGLVIQIPDRDEAGHESVFRYAKFCDQLGLRHKVVWLDEGAKDPDDCHPDYLKEKIEEQLT